MADMHLAARAHPLPNGGQVHRSRGHGLQVGRPTSTCPTAIPFLGPRAGYPPAGLSDISISAVAAPYVQTGPEPSPISNPESSHLAPIRTVNI
jgi:hypothetical protein